MIFKNIQSCIELANCSAEIFAGVFVTVFLRYLLFAGLAYLFVWKVFKDKVAHRWIQPNRPQGEGRFRHEISHSIITFLIFSLTALGIFWLKIQGFTMIYENIADYGVLYFIISIVALIFLHDFYFYVTHRMMHHRYLYKVMHKVHHKSTNPSPWAAFSFHPSEAIVEAGIIPLAVMIMPLHIGAIAIFLLFMTLMNVYGHLGYELLPQGFSQHRLGKWFNTAVHHNMHHQKIVANYGLYFNIWDRVFRTNHPDYHQHFDKVTAPLKSEKQPYISYGQNFSEK